MNLLRTSVLSALAVLTKVATSLFLNKVLALYVGPTGYAVVGQFQSLISMATTFASGAVNTGVTKYTAEYAGDSAKQRLVWTTAASMGLIGALVCGCLLVLVREPLSRWLLGTESYSYVLIWLAAALGLLVLNGLMIAILNGRKAVRELVAANILGSLTGAVLAAALVAYAGLDGALVALAVGPAAACGFTAWMFQRVCPLRWRELIAGIDRTAAKSLGGFALMAATTALVAPLGHMIIRDQLGSTIGWNGAGLWQAMWKISETHLLLLTSTLSVYFLPRLSEIRSGDELRDEIRRGYLFVVPVVLLSGAAIYLLRDQLIRILLTPAFLPLSDILGLQLIGDALKICSWVMSFTMVSHARTRIFVITEVLFTALFVAATVYWARLYGLRGAAAAYGATYLVYWGTMYWLFEGLAKNLNEPIATDSSRL